MTRKPAKSGRTAYQGDAALGRLLTKAGSPLAVAEVRALAAGVAAAPRGRDPGQWIELVASTAGPALRAQLAALEGEYRAAGNGLAVSPAPAERLAALRGELAVRGLDGFVVPLADEHQGEFVPPRAQRLAWLTGFTGSAGTAVVLADRAAVFVDGRYTLQVRDQIDTTAFAPIHIADKTVEQWLGETLRPGQKLGYDPWLHTADGVGRLRAACERAGAALTAVERNPVDVVWRGQPPPPLAPAVPHPVEFAGTASAEKRRLVAERLEADGAEAAVLTAPDSLAWLLNMRGGDVPCTPLVLGFAIITAAGAVDLFVDGRKLTAPLRAAFDADVTVREPADFGAGLDALGAARRRVLVDPATAASWVFDRLEQAGAGIVRAPAPCALPKACKNEVELAGTQAAHVRDGAALTRFLAWLALEGRNGELKELDAVRALYDMRSGGERFQGVSFETISGAGPNGAIVHYRVSEATNRRIAPGELFLIDSGAQYLDGTTDVTRTIYIAKRPGERAPDEARDRFTRVLKGHIAIATARFPLGTTGQQLDALARTALWTAGLDYDHGTGHGVGSFLGVHEGPQRIAKQGSSVPLKPGMIVSNEPGYYKAGHYGIRIENLVFVRPAFKTAGGERDLLEFETLTLAPIDRALVEPGLMTEGEIAWLDAYHARVRDTLTPLVDGKTAEWLARATEPMAR
jgi:Xaa-Pro aminopeptidase